MKKVLLILILALIAGAGVYFSPIGQEKVITPLVQKTIQNQTPKERYELMVKTFQKDVLEALDEFEDINPYTMIYGEDMPLVFEGDSSFNLVLHKIPEMISGGQSVGVKQAKLSLNSHNKVDMSSWIHQKGEYDVQFDVSADLSEPFNTQAGVDQATLNGALQMIVDGENIFMNLESIKSNTPLLQLDTPEIKKILDTIQGKWILFNDAMTNPFLPQGIDPNTVNEKFMKAFRNTLENNLKDFQVWKQPIDGTKTGDWYEYTLELDKEAFLASTKKAYTDTVNTLVESIFYEDKEENKKKKEEMKQVYLSALEEMSLDDIESLTLVLSLHATDTESWKTETDIVMTAGETSHVSLHKTKDSTTGSITHREEQVFTWSVQPNTFHITTEQGKLSGSYSETNIDITLTQEETQVGQLILTRESEGDLWNGSLTIPSLSNDTPIITWDIQENDYNILITQPINDYDFSQGFDQEPIITTTLQEHKITGTYSDENFTATYTQGESQQSLATANFTKTEDIWSGTIDMPPFASIEVEKAMYENNKNLYETMLLAHIIIGGEKTLTLDYKEDGKSSSKVDIQAPEEAIPMVDILEETFGINPYAAQYGEQPETMTEEEIAELLKSLETEDIDISVAEGQ